jgi:hypothetical protein
MLITVEELQAGKIGVSAGKVRIRSARSSNEKKPWKNLPTLNGVVEKPFGGTSRTARCRSHGWWSHLPPRFSERHVLEARRSVVKEMSSPVEYEYFAGHP